MNYEVKQLKSAIAAMMQIVPSRTPLEILKCFRITGEEIQAKSGDVFKATRKIAGGDDDVVVVDARLLSNIVSSLTGDTCEIKDLSHSISVTCGTSKFSIPKRSDKFVFNDPGDLETLGTVTGEALKDAISNVFVSTSEVSGQYSLSCIAISWPLIYATDSCTISIVRMDEGEPSDRLLLINRETAKQAAQCFDPNEDVEISISEKAIRFHSSETEVTCRLAEGSIFKAWKKIDPNPVSVITFDPAEFLSGLRQAFITVNPETAGVTFRFGNDSTSVSSEGKDTGSSDIHIPSKLWGEPCELILDSERLKRLISRIQPSGITMTMSVSEGGNMVTIKQLEDYTYMTATIVYED